MISHKYIGGPTGGEFFNDLPARDLDASELDERQRELLAVGMTLGMYEEVQIEPKGNENEEHGDTEGQG